MKRGTNRESGAALIVAMLLMLVFTIMLIGFYYITSGEQKVAWSNRDNEVTYYWAMAGLEQMSSLIADYFSHTATPVPSTITTWVTTASNFQTYPTTIGTSGVPLVTGTYTLYCAAPPTSGTCDVNTMTLSVCSTVGSTLGYCVGPIGGNGPLQGLEGLIAPFKIVVVADGPSNTEVKLTRTVQEVAVPIFEFGIFSDSDLSFHAGANFAFGGRVHTNGNLYLAEDGGSTLNLNDHVTAAKGIIREQLVNGYTMATFPNTCSSYTNSYCAYVNVLTASNGCPSGTTGSQTGNCLTLQNNQGSVEQGPGSPENPGFSGPPSSPPWKTLSLTTYNGYIKDGTTGAKVLNLAIALPGINSQPISMVQRPPVGEAQTSALGMARFYNQASLRILLSDTASDISNLPDIDTTVQPYPLAESGSSGMSNTIQRTISSNAYYLPALSPLQPPLAESLGSSTDSDYMTAAGTTTLGGYIKIEMNLASSPGTWKDVTEEILAQGISRDLMTPTVEVDLNSGGSLAAGNTYYYVVTALGPWGLSGATAETLGIEYGPYTTTSSYKTINITWNSISGATNYKVYRGSSAGGETGYVQYANTVTSYNETNAALTSGSVPKSTSIVHLEEARPGMAAPTLTTNTTSGNLASNTAYYYAVTALGPWGESAGLQASPITTSSSGSHREVVVSWNAFPGATGYNVYRTTNTDAQTSAGVFTGAGNGCISCPDTVGAGTTTYTDTGSGAMTAQLPPVVTLNSVTAAEYAPNFLPINMYDAREGEVRDTSGPTTTSLNGIMNLVEVDVGNLQQWFAGNIATSGVYAYNGPDALNNSGYILYTSDRRMNCMDGKYDLEGTCASNVVASGVSTAGESAQFGNEDIINQSNSSGAPNQSLDTGEDVNGNGVLDTYGVYAHPIAAPSTTVTPNGTNQSGTWSAILQSLSDAATTHPAFVRITGAQAQKNSVVLFRRALRLVDGTLGNLPPLSAAHPSSGSACSGGTGGGFTVVSENPIYVLGDFNSSVANGFNDNFPLCHVPASVLGDAVTLLSNAWQPGALASNVAQPTNPSYTSGDANDFANPTNPGCSNSRCATTTYYRMAVMAGKTIPFPAYNGTTALLSWGVMDTGTDGGVHNFLRYIEDWSGSTLNYEGSLASFYYSQQATGIYKCCNTVYNAPTRNYGFDTDFQNISKLPPGVPRFTDVNALSYYQSILSTQ